MSLPKNQCHTSFHGGNPGNGYHARSIKKMSSGDTHPYLKSSFWLNPTNQFWEGEGTTEEGKAYFRESLERMG